MEKYLAEIDRLGSILEKAHPGNFSRCAYEVLSSTPLFRYFSPDSLTELRERHQKIEASLDHPCVFSDECFILYRGKEFSIELYHWLYSDTGIHDHNFQGAFQCMAGENHQVEFHFEWNKEIFEGLDLGSLVKVKEKILRPGDSQEIRNEDHFIHTVCHAPSTWNLCIRTRAELNQELNAYHVSGLRYRLRKDVCPDSDELTKFTSTELLHLYHQPGVKAFQQRAIDQILKERHDISYMESMQETSKFLNELGRIAKNY